MRVIVLALLFSSIATPTFAKRWTEPGWYQVTNGILGVFIYAGPFPDMDSCQRTLLPDDQDNYYNCDFLAERPSFDR